MANYKKALEELNNNKVENGKVKEHDLKNGLADIIIDKHFKKQDKKWKVEYAKEIMKEKC